MVDALACGLTGIAAQHEELEQRLHTPSHYIQRNMPLPFFYFSQRVTWCASIRAPRKRLQISLRAPLVGAVQTVLASLVAWTLLLCVLTTGPVLAADPPDDLEAVPEPPPMPSQPLESGESLEPEVTIIRRGETLVEEYRINGRLFAIKVIPDRGAPYFLVDSNGDGDLDERRNELGPDLLIPSWVLFSW